MAFVMTDLVPPIALHAYWDNVVGDDSNNDPNVEAQRLRLEKLWPISALPEYDGKADAKAFQGWADESYHLAWDVAYERSRFEGGVSIDRAAVMSGRYQANRDALGGRRVALSGYRIADGMKLALDYAAAVSAAVKAQ